MSVTYDPQPCTADPRCEYVAGHLGDCTPVEIGKYVLEKREKAHKIAYRQRLDAIVRRIYALWLDELVEEGTSPLLIVGWVSATRSPNGYVLKYASTWHRDRHCRRNRATGQWMPRLYMDLDRDLTPCGSCAQITDEQVLQAIADEKRLLQRKREAIEGICWGQHGYCGRDVEAGWTVCSEHASVVTDACRNGDHDACDEVLSVRVRPDGSTHTMRCGCFLCDHQK